MLMQVQIVQHGRVGADCIGARAVGGDNSKNYDGHDSFLHCSVFQSSEKHPEENEKRKLN